MKIKKNVISKAALLMDYFIPLLIVAGVSIVVFVKATTMASAKNHTSLTFYALSNGFEEYYDFLPAWKPRLFSTSLASVAISIGAYLFERIGLLSAQTPLELTVGLWAAGWFVLISLLFVFFLKRRSLFYILGIFAGVSFGYMDIERTSIDLRLYPWDLPSLFVYALFLLLFIQKRYFLLLFLIPLGVGFKETSMLLCSAFLFADLDWKKRLQFLVISGALSLGMKTALDLVTHSPIFFTMQTEIEGESHFMRNVFSLKSIIPLFINSGTLLALFILPKAENKTIYAIKLIAVLFFTGNFLFGIITEYRIWFELLPLSLYVIDIHIYGDPLTFAPGNNITD